MKPNRYLAASVLLFVVGAFGSGLAANRTSTVVIDKPAFESSNTNSFEINKLVISPTETVLYGDVYSRPNYWVRLSSGSYLKGASGKVYKLRRSEGYPLDSTVYMPVSGNRSFILYTDPLDEGETSFDFTEGDEGGFFVKGLKTTPSTQKGPIHCHLQGTVIDRPFSSRLLLIKAGGDPRVATEQYIPIKEGRFDADINGANIEAFQLIFWDEHINGAWRPIPFFAEPGNVTVQLYPMDQFEKNQMIGGELTNAYYCHLKAKETLFPRDGFIEQIQKLVREGRYESPEAKAISLALRQTNDPAVQDSLYRCREALGKEASLTKEAQALNAQLDSLHQQAVAWEFDFIKNNPSLMAYYVLVDRLDRTRDEDAKALATCTELAAHYASLFPTHPYTVKLAEMLNSRASIHIGGSYVDFSAPDFNGKSYRLSDQIKGKVALIDLWASWCGPCRRSSLSMIPVYEAFKNKGFVIVGVAREESVDHAIKTVQTDKYPWLNLVDVNDQVGVWQKYGVGNAGGATFLVDQRGAILAINPTAEQVTALLKQHLE